MKKSLPPPAEWEISHLFTTSVSVSSADLQTLFHKTQQKSYFADCQPQSELLYSVQLSPLLADMKRDVQGNGKPRDLFVWTLQDLGNQRGL